MRVFAPSILVWLAVGCVPTPDDPREEGSPTFDNDGDGFAEQANGEHPGGDCDDDDATRHPDAVEVCDGVDNDCSGVADDIDTASEEGALYYPDSDGDGAGDGAATPIRACSQPADFVQNGNDCDDGDGDVITRDWWPDGDSDGFGDDDASAVQACEQPTGHVDQAGDCDDALGGVYPGRSEVCADGIDNDCSGAEDDGSDLTNTQMWVVDADEDGFGAEGAAEVEACAAPEDHVLASSGGDCDDSDEFVFPGATEVCDDDDTDEDCDGGADDADPDGIPTEAPTWFTDVDSDGFGVAGSGETTCEPVTGKADNALDCDDDDELVSPAAVEVCDAGDVDEDCDGAADDADPDGSPTNAPTWYADADEDNYGDPATTLMQCVQPSGYVDNDDDCDDTPVSGADITPNTTWWIDLDGDGYGDPDGSFQSRCVQPDGFINNTLDCDDSNAALNPDTIWYPDTDGDGFGDAGGSTVAQCEFPGAGYVANDDDCDDGDGTVGDARVWYVDADADGYGDESASGVTQCVSPPGTHALTNDDCDDDATTGAGVNPGAVDLCNGVDDNCSGDEQDAANALPYYPDSDGDTYGDPDGEQRLCSDPGGMVGNGLDCDDTSGSVNPGQSEVCRNGVDDNCDGLPTPCLMTGLYDGSKDADLAVQSFSGGLNQLCAPLGFGVGRVNDGTAQDVVLGTAHSPGYNQTASLQLLGGGLGTGSKTLADLSDAAFYEEDDADHVGEGIAVGNVNGDAYDDVLIEYESNVRGVEFQFWYGASGFDFGTPNAVFTLDTVLAGYRDVVLEDVNGDTLADIIIGDHHHDSWRGAVYVYTLIPPSSVDLESNSDLIVFEGENQGDYIGGAYDFSGQLGVMGKRTEVIEDFDGDGVADMAFGAQYSDRAFTSAGALYIMQGPFSNGQTYSLADAETIMDAQFDAQGLGVSIDSGDLDGDGLSDVAVGALQYSASVDRAFVVHGSAAPRGVFSASDAWIRLRGLDIGNGVAIGDFDGSGVDDLFSIGYRYTDPGSRATGVLYYDSSITGGLLDIGDADVELDFDLHPNSGARYPGRRGPVMDDLNNDGFDDIVLSSAGRCDKYDEPGHIWNGLLVHYGGGW